MAGGGGEDVKTNLEPRKGIEERNLDWLLSWGACLQEVVVLAADGVRHRLLDELDHGAGAVGLGLKPKTEPTCNGEEGKRKVNERMNDHEQSPSSCYSDRQASRAQQTSSDIRLVV